MQSSFTKANEQQQETQLVARDTTTFGGGCGEFTPNEFEKPQLSLVQGVGDLSGKKLPSGETLYPGNFCLMREYKMPEKLAVTVIGFKKSYQQNIAFSEDVHPQEFETEEEVKANGGNLDYGKKMDEDLDNFLKVARVDLMIEVPEEFPIALDFDGVFYTPAKWKVTKSAFNAVIPRLNSVELPLRIKKQPLASVKFELAADRVEKGGHWIHVPRLTKVGFNTPEFVEFLKSIF